MPKWQNQLGKSFDYANSYQYYYSFKNSFCSIYISYFDVTGLVHIGIGIIFLAGISDYIDGYLARKYNAVSQLGEVLDPIADKILILFVLFGLAVNLSSYFIGFIGATIITREIWVGALRDMNARNGKTNATRLCFLQKSKQVFKCLQFRFTF